MNATDQLELSESSSVSRIPAVIRHNAEWYQLIQSADDQIHKQLGDWRSNKSWEWSVNSTDGPTFDLLMKYGESTKSDRFTRFELANERILNERVRDIWKRLIDAELKSNREHVQRLLREIKEEVVVGH